MSKWTEINAGNYNAATQRLWVAFGEFADQIANQINIDPMFLAHATRFMKNGGYSHLTSEEDARRIMGKNFFGVGEAIRFFGIAPTVQESKIMAKVPFSEDVLRKSKDTHILIAVFPISIFNIRTRHRDLGLFNSQIWYDNQIFADNKGDVGWQLIRKEPIPNSFMKSWIDQQSLISVDEVTPTSRVMVYTIIGHFVSAGKRLFKNTHVRCIDTGSNNDHISVGGFDVGGLTINCWRDATHGNGIGLAAAKK